MSIIVSDWFTNKQCIYNLNHLLTRFIMKINITLKSIFREEIASYLVQALSWSCASASVFLSTSIIILTMLNITSLNCKIWPNDKLNEAKKFHWWFVANLQLSVVQWLENLTDRENENKRVWKLNLPTNNKHKIKSVASWLSEQQQLRFEVLNNSFPL